MSVPCCRGQANHCFRPDRCANIHRDRAVHILWQALLPGVFGQAVSDKSPKSEACCFQSQNLSAVLFQYQPVTKQKRRTISRSPLGRWIRFAVLPWGWPPPENSAVNQLGQDHFLCLSFQAVHVLHPRHLFFLLVRSRVPLQQFFHQLLHPVFCRLFHLP